MFPACCRSRGRRFDDDSALALQGTSPAAQRDHFGAILSAAPDLPAVIYNSPYYGYETRADLFFQMHAEHANLVGFKEFGGKASLTYAAEHITGSDRGFSLLVGVDTQVVHGFLRCGAVGPSPVSAMPSKGGAAFDGACRMATHGDPQARAYAMALEEALGVLSSYDEGPDLVLYYKYLMALEGHEGYENHFNPTDTLTPSQQSQAHARGRCSRLGGLGGKAQVIRAMTEA